MSINSQFYVCDEKDSKCYFEISWLLADEKFWLVRETKVLYDVQAEVGRHC